MKKSELLKQNKEAQKDRNHHLMAAMHWETECNKYKKQNKELREALNECLPNLRYLLSTEPNPQYFSKDYQDLVDCIAKSEQLLKTKP